MRHSAGGEGSRHHLRLCPQHRPEGEDYTILTLGELRTRRWDMFTTVFIGNSQTKVIGNKMVTPGGYLQRDN